MESGNEQLFLMSCTNKTMHHEKESFDIISSLTLKDDYLKLASINNGSKKKDHFSSTALVMHPIP